jgi:hypothetical protein
MSCPYFFPTERLTQALWPHPARLPLGDGWRGRCTAAANNNAEPAEDVMRDCCNLGYAKSCMNLPAGREADAVRFGVKRRSAAQPQHAKSGLAGDPAQIAVFYVCERDYLPVAHGTLCFDSTQNQWTSPHPDPCIQRMAECYLAPYLARWSRGGA